jgi:nucleoside-diphosphate-sugar epimerase
VRLVRGGEILAPADGSDPVQFIDARDLAEWTVHVAEQRSTGVFNASGPARPITMHQMLAEIAQGVEVDPNIVWAPVPCERHWNQSAARSSQTYPSNDRRQLVICGGAARGLARR